MSQKGFKALVLAEAENIQYLTGVLEPSVHVCGVVVIPQQGQAVLAVLWLDKEAAMEQAQEVSVKPYTLTTQGTVIANELEQLEIESVIGMDNRAFTVLGNSLRRSLRHPNLVNASNSVEELRWIKSEEEIRLIQKACEISDEGMRVALESVRPGITELQIAARAEHKMMMMGSSRLKHSTIVGSGRRATLVHPIATQKRIEEGDHVAIDLGAVYQGYCSDIARTFVVGKPSQELENDFAVLRRAQEAVLRKLRPGVSIREMKATAEEVTDTAGCKLIGQLGHGIGLKRGEQPQLSEVGTPYPLDLRIERNMVLALFQSAICSKHCLGVRLEDTVVVTETGAKTLTAYPKELFS